MNLIKRTNIPKKASGIYQIQSKFNGKCYIGSACDLKIRKKNHFQELKNKKHPNRHLQNHYNKYGKADLQFAILEFCEKEMLIVKEQIYINILKPTFNICKIAGSWLGIKHSKETKQKISIANTGQTHSKEVKQKMSKARIGKQTGKNNPMFGKHPSEETIQKMSIARIGKKHSKETKQKMSENNVGMKGKHHSEEAKQKMRKRIPWNKGLKKS